VGGGGIQNSNTLRAVGVPFGLFAAGLVVLATFLPRLHCPTIDIQHNRLIDRDEGLYFLICAGSMIVSAIVGIKDRRAGWLLVLAGFAILGLTIYSATGSRSLLLPSIPGVEGAVHGELGLGLGLSGLAGLLAAGGGGFILAAT
jgi:hypothetical protein